MCSSFACQKNIPYNIRTLEQMAIQRTATAMTSYESNQSDTLISFDKVLLPGERGLAITTRTILYHIYSLWLFTFSDLKTIVVPKTLFGIVTLFSGRSLMQSPRPNSTRIIGCIPFIVLWNWLNLLPLDMSNQNDAKSIIEDKVNKPWRPIPAGRLTVEETRTLIFGSYVVTMLASLYLGGFPECLALIVEGWIYNVLEGANKSLLARNFLNAVGYMTFASGAAKVACAQTGTQLREDSSTWLILLCVVISTTIQFQDLYDQKGDAIRGRRTIPLIAGDRMARLTIAVPIVIWSWVCPAFWGLEYLGFILPIFLGTFIILRLYRYRSVDEDKKSFVIWNAWVMSLYLLPFFGNIM